MLDIRDRWGRLLANCATPGEGSRRSAPPHVMVRDLLHELADALADNGSVELGALSELARQDDSATSALCTGFHLLREGML